MAPDSKTWKPPVLFHFQVEFQWDGNKASASFSEVDGLGQEFVFSGKAKKTDSFPGFPVDIRVPEITLKRSLEPIDEKISSWVRECFGFLDTGWIEACRLIITLLDEDGKAVACWECINAIPVKWRLNPLNASESKIAIETITLKHSKLVRSV